MNLALGNSSVKLASRQAQFAIEELNLQEISKDHPISRLIDSYASLMNVCEPQFVPDLRELMLVLDQEVSQYCLVLTPVEAINFIDFIIFRRGAKMPGVDLAAIKIGEKYSDHILSEYAQHRILELASCLALKRPHYTKGLSARKSSLNVHVFRAVLPVWIQSLQIHGVVLFVAPTFAKIQGPASARSPEAGGHTPSHGGAPDRAFTLPGTKVGV